MNVIRVVGYPRSGNAWAARLLGRLLEAPVYGPAMGQTGSLASDVQGRPDSEYAIVQAHIWQDAEGEVHSPMGQGERPSDWGDAERVLHVVRDPRAVLASIVPFFRLDGYTGGLDAMTKVGGLLGPRFPTWADYVDGWVLWASSHQVETVRYCDLGSGGIERLLKRWRLTPTGGADGEDFATKRAAIQAAGRWDYPHGKREQLHHLRQGTPDGWRTELPRRIAQAATELWSEYLYQYGWEE